MPTTPMLEIPPDDEENPELLVAPGPEAPDPEEAPAALDEAALDAETAVDAELAEGVPLLLDETAALELAVLDETDAPGEPLLPLEEFALLDVAVTLEALEVADVEAELTLLEAEPVEADRPELAEPEAVVALLDAPDGPAAEDEEVECVAPDPVEEAAELLEPFESL